MITLPTLQELQQAYVADLEAKYGESIPTFGKNFLFTVASVQAAKMWDYYKAVGLTQKNVFPDTADPEAIGGTLERFGRIKLGRNPFPATAGEYEIEVTGQIGATIPAGTRFKSDDNATNPGYLFVLDVAYVLTAPTDTITVRSLTTGLDARLFVGDTLTAVNPILNADRPATVLAENIQPQAAEDIEDYRRKVLDAFRLEAQGGAGADYRIWSFDVQGVEQSYPYAVGGAPGEINLFIEATIVDSIDGKGTPTPAILADVEAAIEQPTATRPSRKPLTVYDIHYLPVTIKEIDIEITGFVGLTPAIQTAIFEAMKLVLSLTRPYVSSIDILDLKNDIFDTNIIIATILAANPGSTFGSVVLKVDSNPVPTYQFINGDIPNLNSIVYV